MMFCEIKEQVSVPVGLTLLEGNLGYAMPTGVNKNGIGTVDNFPAAVASPSAEVDVFEPNGEEVFIKSSHVFKGLSPDSEASTCWLFHFLRTAVVKIQAAVTTVEWIVRPGSIEQQHLCEGAGQSRQASDCEPSFGGSCGRGQHASGSSDFLVGECFRNTEQSCTRCGGVRIQDQEYFAFSQGRRLIYPRGEASILRICQNANVRCDVAGYVNGLVAGCVVDHHNIPVGLVPDRTQARLHVAGRIVRDDDDGPDRHGR